MQKYLGAVAARPRAGFGRDIMGGGPNLALTWVVTAPNQPPQYVIDILPFIIITRVKSIKKPSII